MDLRDEQPDRHEFGRRVYLVANVDPLDLDGVRTVAVGTGVWLLAFLGLLPFWSPLQDSGRLWWVWTCMAGVSLGLFGLEYCRRRRTARESRDSGGTNGTVSDGTAPDSAAPDSSAPNSSAANSDRRAAPRAGKESRRPPKGGRRRA